jgi:hypothetical protein
LFLIPFDLFSNGSKGFKNNDPTPANWILKHEYARRAAIAIATAVAIDKIKWQALTAQVPIPFSVFPSAYRNAVNQETTTTKVEGEVKLPEPQAHGREGHEETHESFTATVHQHQHQDQPQQPPVRDTHIKEEVRIYEEERRRPQPAAQPQPLPQHREEVHIHEETRYRQPERAQSR